MKKSLLILVVSFVSVSMNAFAQSYSDSLDEAAASFYTINCGTLKDLLAMDGMPKLPNGEISDSDLAELVEIRAPILNVLLKGAPAIKELLDLGDKQDTGPFGAIMACSQVAMMEPMIKKNGCVIDLKTEKRVYDGPGFTACAKLNASLPK
jgi:hypothetical protein